MWSKLKSLNLQKYLGYSRDIRDVRVLGLLIFGGIVVLVTWSGVGVIQTNYDLQKKIARLQQEVDLKKLENSNLGLRNQYFETDQYLELQARRQFNRAAPGETLLIVPKTVALANSVEPLAATKAPEAPSESQKPAYQQNFEAWMEFLFRRKPMRKH